MAASAISYLVYVLASLSIVATIASMVVLTVHRKTFGHLIMLVGVMVLAVPPSPAACAAGPIVYDFGFTLTASMLLCKNYRIYAIFRSRRASRKVSMARVMTLAAVLVPIGTILTAVAVAVSPVQLVNGVCSWTTPAVFAGPAVWRFVMLIACSWIGHKTEKMPAHYVESRAISSFCTLWAIASVILAMLETSTQDSTEMQDMNNMVRVLAVAVGGFTLLREKLAKVYSATEDQVSGDHLVRVGTGWSLNSDTQLAVIEAWEMAKYWLKGEEPHYVRIDVTEQHDCKVAMDTLHQLAPNCRAMHGATTAKGVMSNEGVHHNDDDLALGLFVLYDPGSSAYGVGGAVIGEDPVESGRVASRAAATVARRNTRTQPDVVLMSAAPGKEEQLLDGIQATFGDGTHITGGSSGDNHVAGNWRQFYWDPEAGRTTVMTNGVVLSVMYPSVHVSTSFYTGYAPSIHRGVMTKVGERTIYEIDGQPASEVYERWCGGITDTSGMNAVQVLERTSLFPFGREIGRSVDHSPLYQLVLPIGFDEKDKSISTLGAVQQDEELVMMAGTKDNLKATISCQAVKGSNFRQEEISAAFVVYCAGCMWAVGSDISDVAVVMNKLLGEKPWMSAFTFGEQGTFQNGRISHGNNMFSVLIFSTLPKTHARGKRVDAKTDSRVDATTAVAL